MLDWADPGQQRACVHTTQTFQDSEINAPLLAQLRGNEHDATTHMAWIFQFCWFEGFRGDAATIRVWVLYFDYVPGVVGMGASRNSANWPDMRVQTPIPAENPVEKNIQIKLRIFKMPPAPVTPHRWG